MGLVGASGIGLTQRCELDWSLAIERFPLGTQLAPQRLRCGRSRGFLGGPGLALHCPKLRGSDAVQLSPGPPELLLGGEAALFGDPLQ